MKALKIILVLFITILISSCSNSDDEDKNKSLPVESETYFTHRDKMYILEDKMKIDVTKDNYYPICSVYLYIKINISECFSTVDDLNQVVDGELYIHNITIENVDADNWFLDFQSKLSGEFLISEENNSYLKFDTMIQDEKMKQEVKEGKLTIELIENTSSPKYKITFKGKDNVGQDIILLYKSNQVTFF
jgi:hypothetical protein